MQDELVFEGVRRRIARHAPIVPAMSSARRPRPHRWAVPCSVPKGHSPCLLPSSAASCSRATDPDRFRAWYARAFGVEPTPDGFIEFGGVSVLIDRRDDIAPHPAEPTRVIVNFHVADLRATAAHLDGIGVVWILEPEFRGDAWFATFSDPDGNVLQIIELTPAYYAARAAADLSGARRRRDSTPGPGPRACAPVLLREARARTRRGTTGRFALRVRSRSLRALPVDGCRVRRPHADGLDGQ